MIFPRVGSVKIPFLQTLEVWASLLVLPLTALAQPQLESRLWYADNGQDTALVGGAEFGLEPAETWRLRLAYAQGAFNPGGDVEHLTSWRGLVTRSRGPIEVGAGYAAMLFDTELQPNWAWSYPAEEQERNADAHGPVLHARLDYPLGATPLVGQAAFTWLIHDFGDFDELGYDGSYVDLETGLAYRHPRLTVGVGYRLLIFNDLPPRQENQRRYSRNQMDGLFAQLTFRF